MATRIWSRADVGIWQEDTLVPDSTVPRYIDSSNMTGLTTGLGFTLGPKSNKLLITNSYIRNFYLDPDDNSDTELNFAYGDDGEIYRFDSADNTPIYTDTGGGTIEGFFKTEGDYFYQSEPSDLAKSINNDFDTVTEDYYTGLEATTSNVSVVTSRGQVYYPNGDQITKFSSAGVYISDITGFNGDIKALIPYGGNLYAYTSNRVYGLSIEGDADTITSESAIGFTVKGSTTKDGLTYLVTNDGELKAGNGRQFSNLSNVVQSNRLNDNSDYVTKFNFGGTSTNRGNTIVTAGKNIYVACNDGTPGIYIYGSIMEGYTKGFHKAITTIHDGTAIDIVYCVGYSDADNRVYYAYLAGTQYGIDYIDVDSKETTETGYAVTEVFSANTTFIKRAGELRITVEGVSGNNYVKLYQRVNNGSWTLLRNITGETGIVKKEISKYAKENIEVQFKVECYNESGTTPPIVRELYYLYEVTEK